MKKQISKLNYFLFHKEHKILENKKLFRFQNDLAKFAVKVSGTSFFKKAPESIRPFLNQQLKVDGEVTSKPINNHRKIYFKIVEARLKDLKPDITANDLKIYLQEFNDFFSKEIFVRKHEKVSEMNFGTVTVQLLKQLQVVATANGGALTQEEFIKAIVNLKNLS